MKTSLLFIGLICLNILTFSCTRDEFVGFKESDTNPPGAVKVTKIENKPGSAEISYTLPSDNDLAYVMAEYEIHPGNLLNTKSSSYNNSILIEGFGDTLTHTVNLYAVDKSGNKSSATQAIVNPLAPDIINISKTLQLREDFGGLNIRFINSNQTSIAAVILYTNAAGELVPWETYYTSRDTVSYSSRGLPPAPSEFGVYFRDRWGNLSDTLLAALTPFEEIKIDKTKFKEYLLPGDYRANAWGTAMYALWDEKYSGNYCHTDNTLPGQQYFTFDMGALAKLSRFTLWEADKGGGQDLIYANGNPKRYEVWGIGTTPPADGSWTGWYRLAYCLSVKPSGLPPGSNTQADWDAARQGEEWNVDVDAPAVRYIRLKCLENWGYGKGWMHVAEMSFWGKIVN
jgi:hypothetical protein